MFYFGDIARFYYPTRLLYANALHSGRLPFWQPEILAGFPLFAEMQTGALYPIHLLLYYLAPIDVALNYDILLHLAWLGIGTYLFARGRGISVVGAVISALALEAGGFGVARVTHPNVLDVAAWLPWTLLLYEKWRNAGGLRYWVLLVLVFVLQWLGGHPQFSLIISLTFAVYVIAMTLINHESATIEVQHLELERIEPASVQLPPKFKTHPALIRVWNILIPLSALALGTLIAAPQLLPTYELAQLSTRAGGVGEAFFTQFSYHPLYLALLVDPFLLGNPYPAVSVEVIAYLGIIPILLAAAAIVIKRDRITFFWLGLALAALLLAFGGFTPLYRVLRFLPGLNFFRVPARFLLPFAFSGAMLAGIGYDALVAKTRQGELRQSTIIIGGIFGTLAILIIALGQFIPVDYWLDAWRALPIIFAALGIWLILRARRASRNFWAVSILGLTVLDLLCFGSVYAQTYNVIGPSDQIFPRPRVLDQLDLSDGARVLTSEWIIPWVSVMNESLYPNLNAAHAVRAVGGYTPLVPELTQKYLENLSSAMVSLLGVRYYLIPQALPVNPEAEGADVRNPFLADPIAEPLEFSPVDADSIEIESSLAQSVALKDGDIVANLVLTTEGGHEITRTLRAGLDTSEWAYDRSDVRRVVQHSRAPIASTFPARSAFPIETHDGHTYRAAIKFSDSAVPITRLRVDPVIPAGLIHIQDIALLNGAARIDLDPLLGKGNYALTYRSEDVAVFENRGYSPRAFLTHSAYVVDDATALARLRSPEYGGELLLAGGEELPSDVGQGFNEDVKIVQDDPEKVVLDVTAEFDGYLVLADAWDPNWSAMLDGVPVPIERADVMFRAVRVPEGSHRVEFSYHPRSFYTGLLIAGIAIALLGVLILATVLVRLWRPQS